MAIGFPAKYKEIFQPDKKDTQATFGAAKKAISALGWSLGAETPNQLRGATEISLVSWGEKIIIDANPDGSLTLLSKCAFPLQMIDYGRNRRNVQQLIAEIKKQLG